MGVDAAWLVGMETQFSTMGVDAVVTRPAPNNTPLSTRVIWLAPENRSEPFGTDPAMVDPRRVACFQASADLPNVPKGTLISAPELEGGTVKNWRADNYGAPINADEIRVFVTERP